MATIIVIVSS